MRNQIIMIIVGVSSLLMIFALWDTLPILFMDIDLTKRDGFKWIYQETAVFFWSEIKVSCALFGLILFTCLICWKRV